MELCPSGLCAGSGPRLPPGAGQRGRDTLGSAPRGPEGLCVIAHPPAVPARRRVAVPAAVCADRFISVGKVGS